MSRLEVKAGLLAEKIEKRVRLTREDGLMLLHDIDLVQLGQWGKAERMRRFPKTEITFVVDSNPNYTNVCDTDCTFCGFYRRPGDAEA